jgi:hypothetical protein
MGTWPHGSGWRARGRVTTKGQKGKRPGWCAGAGAWLGVRAMGAVGGLSPAQNGAHACVRSAAVRCGVQAWTSAGRRRTARRSHLSARPAQERVKVGRGGLQCWVGLGRCER